MKTLISLNALAPVVVRAHYGQRPVRCSEAVLAVLLRACETSPNLSQWPGVVHDLLWSSQNGPRKLDGFDAATFEHTLATCETHETHTFRLSSDPVVRGQVRGLTISLQSER